MYVICRPTVDCGNLKQVKAHYNQNRDFVVLSPVNRNLLGGGEYVSKSVQSLFDSFEDGMKLEVRYGKNMEKVVIL